MTTATQSAADERQQIGPLLAAVLLVAAPHAQNLAPAVMAFFAILLLWRIAALYRVWRLPSQGLLFLLTFAGAGIVLGQYHRIWGAEAGSSLFISGLGLKLMEMKNSRDAYLVVFLAFFVALTQYLFSQSIPMAAYTLAVVVLLVTAMIGLNSDEAFPLKARLKMAAAMVAQAVPLMVLLFVFFPRVQGPLWELPDETLAAKTGLGDTLAPGSVSRLALSQQTAFRVDFEGPLPPPKQRYWRGLVFWYDGGARWILSPEFPLNPAHKPRFDGPGHAYTITLEPHNQRWIYALDLPQVPPHDVMETIDYQLMHRDAITERKQYRLISGTAYHTGPLGERELRRGLQLASHPSPRLRALVEAWKAESATPKQFVQRALRYFHEEKFYYTLKPPLTQGDPVDSFLFDTRQGFCEHYATSFVVLMRMAHIPARVVTGYQGGQWNSVGHFLEVKQADAHAWAEVWLEESGWTRVDPTAAVAPERIERGLDVETQVASGEVRFNAGDGAMSAKGLGFGSAWLKTRMFAASINHLWHSWVLTYDTDSQSHLLRWLGAVDWRSVAAWLGIGLGFSVGVVAWLILPKRRDDTDPARRVYGQFLDKIASWDLVPQTGEGACRFAKRVGLLVPELADAAERITRLYLRVRYESRQSPDDLGRLRRLVRALPRRQRRLWGLRKNVP